MKFQFIDKNYFKKYDFFWNWIEMKKTEFTIQIQNRILKMDCQPQSNSPNWIPIRIEQSSNSLIISLTGMIKRQMKGWGVHPFSTRD